MNQSSFRSAILLSGVLLGMLLPTAGVADLCKPSAIWDSHRAEARAAMADDFSAGDYQGQMAYDSWLIACNRIRDSHGGALNGHDLSRGRFDDDLPPRLVSGGYRYFSLFPLKYAYQIERKGGDWIVTVPLEFYLPKGKNHVDLPMALARQLNITSQCRNGNQVPGWACRVSRNLQANGRTVTSHLMSYWRRTIEFYWSRPGFKLVTPVVNLSQVPPALLRQYRKHRTVWEVRMNDNPKSRPRYKDYVGNPNPIYTGLGAVTLSHEFGHHMGLDDEYREPSIFYRKYECAQLGGQTYLMCSTYGGRPSFAKGVYAWIVSRRYLVGSPLQIK